MNYSYEFVIARLDRAIQYPPTDPRLLGAPVKPGHDKMKSPSFPYDEPWQ